MLVRVGSNLCVLIMGMETRAAAREIDQCGVPSKKQKDDFPGPLLRSPHNIATYLFSYVSICNSQVIDSP